MTYIFHTYLLRDKKVSRDIEIEKSQNLYKLAEAIVNGYNFSLDHCFGFFSDITEFNCFNSEKRYELFADLKDVEPTGAQSVKKTKIAEVWQKTGDKMMFLFDYGDEWRFAVVLKELGQKESKEKYPRIVNKKGRAPEQYPPCR